MALDLDAVFDLDTPVYDLDGFLTHRRSTADTAGGSDVLLQGPRTRALSDLAGGTDSGTAATLPQHRTTSDIAGGTEHIFLGFTRQGADVAGVTDEADKIQMFSRSIADIAGGTDLAIRVSVNHPLSGADTAGGTDVATWVLHRRPVTARLTVIRDMGAFVTQLPDPRITVNV